jgi:hypothetical protein
LLSRQPSHATLGSLDLVGIDDFAPYWPSVRTALDYNDILVMVTTFERQEWLCRQIICRMAGLRAGSLEGDIGHLSDRQIKRCDRAAKRLKGSLLFFRPPGDGRCVDP